MNNKKSLFINMIATTLAFVINAVISFIITPYLVKILGDEAYGFIGLANNFVSYASIITVALNSMAARFITIEIHKKNEEKANEYFNSVLFSNIIIALVLAVISVYLIFNLNDIINISPELVKDVKITFALSFFNFIIGVIASVYGVATFVKNRMDMTSIRNVIANIIRIITLIILFALFKPKIYYIVISATIYTIVVIITDMIFTKKLLPDLKLKWKAFNRKAVKTLISSGIWNSINSLSSALLTGLDLVIANLFLGGQEMGILSIAKTLPTQITSFLSMISSVFTPQFTILYAENNIEELVKEVKFSIKVLTFIMTVPIAGFIIFGTEFYSLWMPYKSQEQIIMIQILSILTLGPNIISSYIYTLYSINTVTNKLKLPVILTLILSIISTALVFVLLKRTNLGIYAVAGVSSIILLLRVIIFVPIYAAHNLKIKWTTFYPILIKSTICFGVLAVFYYIIKCTMNINSWGNLILVAGIAGIMGYILNIYTVFNRNERNRIMSLVIKKIKKEG